MPKNCVSCNAPSLKPIEDKWEHTLYECGACMMQFWWPFKNPDHEWYEQNKRFKDRNAHPKGKKLYQSQELFLRELPKKGGTLLDVGMGTGRFLDAARHAY